MTDLLDVNLLIGLAWTNHVHHAAARAWFDVRGAVKAKLPLSQRTYTCTQCGLVLDRDQNAARILLNLAASGAERLNACELL